MNPSEFSQDDLIAALRAERAAPGPEFAAALDARLADGFRREGSLGELRRLLERLPSGRRALLPALSGVAVAVVAIGVAISQPEFGKGPGTGPRPLPTAVSGGSASAPTASVPPVTGNAHSSAQAIELAPSPPVGDTAFSTKRARSVERSAQLTLATQPSKVETVADNVVRVVDRHNGIVSSSSVTGGDALGAGAQFQLLIPGDQLQMALADLSGLAHVRSRTEGTLDITRPVIDASVRLKEALKGGNKYEIAAARAEVRSLRHRVRYSRVDLSIVGDESASGSWGFGNAAHDAGRVLVVIAGSALVGLAVLVPLALLSTVTWLGYAAIRRRSRERMLDQPS